MFSRVKSFIAG